jgi:CBS domain-containing protein
MAVRDVMQALGPVVSPTTTLAEAVEALRACDRAVLPVCEPPALLGTISSEDIQRRIRTQDRDPTQATVREAMRSDRQYCFDDQDGGRIAQLMREREIAHLVVLNREWVPVGSLCLAELPPPPEPEIPPAETSAAEGD